MELIEALERLSLEIKRDSAQKNVCDNTKAISFDNVSQLSSRGSKDYGQLQEFDRSVETLFAQINDLNQTRPPVKFTSTTGHSKPSSGSVDTSQEDDSDASSSYHSAASCNMNHITHGHLTVHLVQNLMRRDLHEITYTVKKISQILSIGSEMELIHKNISSSQFDHECRDFDLMRIEILCDTFKELCLSEPHIMELPTIVRYTDYCTKLREFIGSRRGQQIEMRSDSSSDLAHNALGLDTTSVWTFNKLYERNDEHQ